MPVPWNFGSACPRAPREIHISDSAAYFTGVAPKDGTGVGSGNPTGVESFLFLSRSMLHAPCALRLLPQVPPLAGRSSSAALLFPFDHAISSPFST